MPRETSRHGSPAHAIVGLKDNNGNTGLLEFPRDGQAGETGADHDNIEIGGLVVHAKLLCPRNASSASPPHVRATAHSTGKASVSVPLRLISAPRSAARGAPTCHP